VKRVRCGMTIIASNNRGDPSKNCLRVRETERNNYKMKNERYKSFTEGKESYSSFLVPDFVDIQRKSFFRLLEKGIVEEFSKVNPIVSNISQLKLTFYPERYLLILPDFSLSEAIVQGKTYSCKLYVPVLLGSHKAEASSSVKGESTSSIYLSNNKRVDVVKPSTTKHHFQRTSWTGAFKPTHHTSGPAVYPMVEEEDTTRSGDINDVVGASFSEKTMFAKRDQEINWQGVAPKNIYVTNRTSEQMLSEEDRSVTNYKTSDLALPDDIEVYTSGKGRRGAGNEAPFGLGDKKTETVTHSKRRTPLLTGRDSNGYTLSLPEAKIPFKEISLAKDKRAVQRNREGALSWVLLGNLPLMTKRGHFVINGSPRVLVNQLTRCPGIYFHERRWGVGKTEKRLVYADFVSRRGAWLRLQADKAGEVWARLKRTPKVPFALFYQGMIACESNPLQWTASDQDTLVEMYEEVNPTKRESSPHGGKAFLDQKFKNPRTYDLGVNGRDQLNIRFGTSIATQQLTSKDLYYAFEKIKELQNHRIFADDIDNLSNRRVRAAGDLVQGQFETGLYRLEKVVLAKMRKPIADVSCKTLLTSKPLNGALREFFGSSPLSQYMDQTNPLAEVTQKRRVSSLGPGGISRETAGMAIRGIHPTHYGRICPIETPEGKNAGLVNSLTAFTQVREDGTLESPYYAILQGQVQNEEGFRFLPVEEEEQHSIKIAPGDVKTTNCRFLPSNLFPIREAGNPQEDFRHASRETVNVMAVSPIQMISIATSLIPFLEHDDANRALMGSNMQRQAVPLLRPERPIVGTGLEALVIAASGHAVESHRSGYISFVSSEKVMIYSKSFSFNANIINDIDVIDDEIDKDSCSSLYDSKHSHAGGVTTAAQPLFHFADKVMGRGGPSKPLEIGKNVTDRLDTHSYIGGTGYRSQKIETDSQEIVTKTDLANAFRRGLTPSSITLMITSCGSRSSLKRIWVQNLQTEGTNTSFKGSFSFANTSQLATLRRVSSVSNPNRVKRAHESLGAHHLTRNQLPYRRYLQYWKGVQFNKVAYKGGLLEGVSPQTAQDGELEQNLPASLSVINKGFDGHPQPSRGVPPQEPKWGLQHLLTSSLQINWGGIQGGSKDQRIQSVSSIGQSRLETSTYSLQGYCRSNQETCLNHVPAVTEGEWIQEGDLIADCSASHLGELALGKNVRIAYLPWEGYNFEDAVVISERLVLEDVYTSIHIQKYEVETKETKFGFESITRDVPGLGEQRQARLDKYGVATIGSWVREGDILVGKATPKGLQPLSPYERLAYDIANVEAATMEDTSLRVPKGVEGRVINYHAYNDTFPLMNVFEPSLRGPLASRPLKEPNSPNRVMTGCPSRVRIYLAEERRIQVGDKVAGRHGNKGIVSTILPRQDMPYLPDGQIVDVVLNPLGIPSRMNVGQVFECLLGLAGMQLGQHFQVTPFDEVYGAEASRSLVYLKLYQARLRTNQNWIFDFKFPGKVALFDGRTGQLFDQWVTVGQAYMLKLVHLVDEKIHARSTGPYSLVTKQPLGGRSKHGGQRLGEMEVWALEGFGAAYILQEMLTSKSDDVVGREQAVEAILFKGKMSLGNPEAFKVLVRELQSLCLDVGVYAISANRLHREVIDVGSI
jgi:DNA-directed RNA polymerase beta subunit